MYEERQSTLSEPYGSRQDEPRPDGFDEEAQLLGAEGSQSSNQAREDFEIEDPQLIPPASRFTLRQLAGPSQPRIQVIKPLFPSLQLAPVRFLHNRCPKPQHKTALLCTYLLIWAIAFLLALGIGGHSVKDGTGRYVVNLDCVDRLWMNKNDCGLDGVDCRPFSNDHFTFRCPASCAGVRVLNPYVVGPLSINYRPLVIGNSTYRGDSFICGSAIHAGIISDGVGGCGHLTRLGEQQEFLSSSRNGIESVSFDSYFPLSFKVIADDDFQCGRDARHLLLIISVVFTVLLSLFTTSSSILLFVTFTASFMHVSFVSDPPGASYHNISVLPDHLSTFAARFLPAIFSVVVLYWSCIRRTLAGLEAQLEKTLLWLGGLWTGALSNYTFEWIPISRLTAHDLEQQPGAKLALGLIILTLLLVVAQQMRSFWLERRLLPYLALYGVFIAGILICLTLPGVNLRIHHYILALLLLPGTSIQTRPSLFYQGLLLGLFVNGIARWGFDSILQTVEDLRGDASIGSLLPLVMKPLISLGTESSNVSFSLAIPPLASADFMGISVLVNDVERHRQSTDEAELSNFNFTWHRPAVVKLPEYFRFAYMKDGRTLDYTAPGTWHSNGTWSMGNTAEL